MSNKRLQNTYETTTKNEKNLNDDGDCVVVVKEEEKKSWLCTCTVHVHLS